MPDLIAALGALLVLLLAVAFCARGIYLAGYGDGSRDEVARLWERLQTWRGIQEE